MRERALIFLLPMFIYVFFFAFLSKVLVLFCVCECVGTTLPPILRDTSSVCVRCKWPHKALYIEDSAEITQVNRRRRERTMNFFIMFRYYFLTKTSE